MRGIINVEFLMKLLCIASIQNRNSNFAPDVCDINVTSQPVSSAKEVYTPEECLASGSFERDLRKFTNMVVDVDVLLNVLKNLSDCDICTTDECNQEAEEILLNLNEQVSPCHDFYEFACGGWMKKHTVNKTKPYVSVYSELENDIPLQLSSMLGEKIRRKNHGYVRLIKGIYQSCMDVDNLSNMGIERLNEVLKDLGKWPILEIDPFDYESYDWIDTVIKLRQKGFSHNTLISLSVVKDPDNSTNNIIKLDHPSFGINGDHLNSDINIRDYYLQLILKASYILKSNDSSLSNYTFKHYIQYYPTLYDMFDFEGQLASMRSRFSFRMSGQGRKKNRYTIQQLSEEVKGIDWFKYFSGILSDKIYGNESVLINDIDYIESLVRLIRNNKKKVANYLHWRAIHESFPFLSKDWRTLNERTKEKPDVQENQPRWKQCLDFVTDNFDIAVNTYYMRRYFRGHIISEINFMFRSLKHALKTDLLKNIMRLNATEQMAKEKASSMEVHISYPANVLSDFNVSRLYADLKLSNESYLEKVLKMRKWSADNSLHLHISPSQRDALELRRLFQEYAKGSTAKIIYNYRENRIDVPTGILQKAFFKKHRPQSLNWGAVGYLIAKEVTNAFFYEGQFYDSEGRQIKWRRPEIEEDFNLKESCFSRQYHNYVHYDLKVDLKKDRVEVPPQYVAENAGLKMAYLAYDIFTTNEKDEMLPGLTYTHKQLFWINAAQAMCEKHTREYLEKRLINGSYVPSHFSVIGTMSNLPEFAKDFNCPKDSEMNPVQKCDIW